MKRTTVVLTDEQAKRLAEERQRLGVPASEIVRRALNAYLDRDGVDHGGADRERDLPAERRGRGDLRGIIGIGDSSRRTYTAADVERIRADEFLRYIWEDSFGGERSFDDLLATLRTDGAQGDEAHLPGSER